MTTEKIILARKLRDLAERLSYFDPSLPTAETELVEVTEELMVLAKELDPKGHEDLAYYVDLLSVLVVTEVGDDPDTKP